MAKNRDKKKPKGFNPKLGVHPADRAYQPSAIEQPDKRKLRPAWSFALVDHDGPFGWSNCKTREDMKNIADMLKDYEAKQWNDLRKAGCHEIEVDNCSWPAQKRLIEIGKEDFDTLYSLPITAKQRVFAVKQGHLLAILWWDPEHQVCPSELKNT